MNCKHGQEMPYDCAACANDADKREANHLQRRRYAEAALTGLASQFGDNATHTVMAVKAFKIADAMLAEQRRREGGE